MLLTEAVGVGEDEEGEAQLVRLELKDAISKAKAHPKSDILRSQLVFSLDSNLGFPSGFYVFRCFAPIIHADRSFALTRGSPCFDK